MQVVMLDIGRDRSPVSKALKIRVGNLIKSHRKTMLDSRSKKPYRLKGDETYGNTLMSLEVVVCRSFGPHPIDNMATDGIRLLVNPEFALERTEIDIYSILIHEANHVKQGHSFRRKRWEDRHGKKESKHLTRSAEELNWAFVELEQRHKPDDAMKIPEGVISYTLEQLATKYMKEWVEPEGGEQPSEGDIMIAVSGGSSGDGEGDASPSATGISPGTQGEKDDDKEESEEGRRSTASIQEEKEEEEEETTEGEDESQADDGPPQDIGSVLLPMDDDGNELSTEEVAELEEKLKESTKQDAQVKKFTGGTRTNMDALHEKQIDTMVKGHRSWRNELQALFKTKKGERMGDDYTKPSRMSMAINVYMPQPRREGLDWLVMGFDVSYSINESECQAFIREMNSILADVSFKRITIIPFNGGVRQDRIIEVEAGQKLPDKFQIGGGTDYRPVFNWIEREMSQPDMLVMFTDLDVYGDAYPETPPYDVLWAASVPLHDEIVSTTGYVTQMSNRPPFGDCIEVDLID